MVDYQQAMAPWRRGFLAVAVTLLSILVTLALLGRADRLAAEAGATILSLTAGILALTRARELSGQRRFAWNMLGAACLAWSAGAMLVTYTEAVQRAAVPVPSLADAGFLAIVPFSASALLAMVGGRTTVTSRVRTLLDALLIATSILLLVYASGAPAFAAADGPQPQTARAIAVAYPLADLFLLSLLLLVLLRAAAPVPRTLVWLGVALLGIMAGNLASFAQAADRLQSNSWTDICRIAGFLIVTYAAIRPIAPMPAESAYKPGVLIASLPLVPFGVAIAAVMGMQARDRAVDPFIFWNAAILVILLAARQYFMLHENLLLRRQADVALATVEQHERLRTQMLNNITHDMRHHLSPTTMHLGMLAAWPEPMSDRQRRSLAIIGRSTDQVARLASDLSDAVHLEAGHFAMQSLPVDVAQAARDVVESLRTMAEEKGITLGADAPSSLVVVGDRDRLVQVLFNLVSNAVRFTPAGGTVRLVACQVATKAQIEVRDTGRGLSQEQLSVLFQPFTQVHERHAKEPGMGLGLYISRGIVEQQGGVIRATSAGPGQGAAFIVELPMLASRGANDGTATAPTGTTSTTH